MESFVGKIYNFFFGRPPLELFTDDECFSIITDKTSSSERLKEVKDFLERKVTTAQNILKSTKSLFEMAEREHTKALVREDK